MTSTPIQDFSGSEHHDAELDAAARAAVTIWLHDHPEAVAEVDEAARAHIHLRELSEQASQTGQAAAELERRAAGVAARQDPAGRKVLGLAAGTITVVALTVLDVVPLNWAAQAFNLGNAGTWLITGILLVASIGAMAGLEMTRSDRHRRIVLATIIAIVSIGIAVMRTQFLWTVAGESMVSAIVQGLFLTAMSVGLILLGSAVMARTRSLSLARGRAAAQRARQLAQERQGACRQADEQMKRHLIALHHRLILRSSLGSAAPAWAGHSAWTAALERAVRGLFPGL
jgi:hypothetical protein